jgi:hypothetical protein
MPAGRPDLSQPPGGPLAAPPPHAGTRRLPRVLASPPPAPPSLPPSHPLTHLASSTTAHSHTHSHAYPRQRALTHLLPHITSPSAHAHTHHSPYPSRRGPCQPASLQPAGPGSGPLPPRSSPPRPQFRPVFNLRRFHGAVSLRPMICFLCRRRPCAAPRHGHRPGPDKTRATNAACCVFFALCCLHARLHSESRWPLSAGDSRARIPLCVRTFTLVAATPGLTLSGGRGARPAGGKGSDSVRVGGSEGPSIPRGERAAEVQERARPNRQGCPGCLLPCQRPGLRGLGGGCGVSLLALDGLAGSLLHSHTATPSPARP